MPAHDSSRLAAPGDLARPGLRGTDAARRSDVDAVKTMRRNKSVDVNATAADGSTALEWAVQRDNASIVDALI